MKLLRHRFQFPFCFFLGKVDSNYDGSRGRYNATHNYSHHCTRRQTNSSRSRSTRLSVKVEEGRDALLSINEVSSRACTSVLAWNDFHLREVPLRGSKVEKSDVDDSRDGGPLFAVERKGQIAQINHNISCKHRMVGDLDERSGGREV